MNCTSKAAECAYYVLVFHLFEVFFVFVFPLDTAEEIRLVCFLAVWEGVNTNKTPLMAISFSIRKYARRKKLRKFYCHISANHSGCSSPWSRQGIWSPSPTDTLRSIRKLHGSRYLQRMDICTKTQCFNANPQKPCFCYGNLMSILPLHQLTPNLLSNRS